MNVSFFSQVFYWTGVVAWVLGILYLLLHVVSYVWLSWEKKKFRYWIYQPYEYLKLIRSYKQLKKAGWKTKEGVEINWLVVKVQKARFEGRVKGYEYRKRNLFKKQILKIYNKLLATDEYKAWDKAYGTV